MPFFDLATIKIRAPIQTFLIPDVPTKLFAHEPDRLVVIFYIDGSSNGYITVGRSYNAVRPMQSNYAGQSVPLEIYGPDEIWVTGSSSGVFTDVSGFYQAVYRD